MMSVAEVVCNGWNTGLDNSLDHSDWCACMPQPDQWQVGCIPILKQLWKPMPCWQSCPQIQLRLISRAVKWLLPHPFHKPQQNFPSKQFSTSHHSCL